MGDTRDNEKGGEIERVFDAPADGDYTIEFQNTVRTSIDRAPTTTRHLPKATFHFECFGFQLRKYTRLRMKPQPVARPF